MDIYTNFLLYWKIKFFSNYIHENFFAITEIQNLIMPVPALQKPAPAFQGTAVVNGEFKDISLSDYKGKYLVLFFYPLDLYVF